MGTRSGLAGEAIAAPTYKGVPLDTSPGAFGNLRRSAAILDDPIEQRRRLDEDGYLYLPGYLDAGEVRAVRTEILRRLAEEGLVDVASGGAVCAPDAPATGLDYRTACTNEYVQNCEPLRRLVFGGRMMGFWQSFFDGPAIHFNHIWFRAKRSGPDAPTPPHCDALYMGRGSQRVYTCWIPYGDVARDMGGIMLLEGSHRLPELRDGYCRRDVDVYDPGREDAKRVESGEKTFQESGEYSLDAIGTRERLGGRWLTSEFSMGDLLIFGIYTLHASTDNRSGRLRISSDTRYQPASEPVDDRWAGARPIGHGPRAKRAIAC